MAAAPPAAKEANSKSLAYGVKAGNIAQVTSLLDAGANPNAFETRLTPVCADGKGHDKIKVKTTALMQAVLCGELEIAQLLLDRGADADLRTERLRSLHCTLSPLMAAASRGKTAMVRLLIAHGAVWPHGDPRAAGCTRA
jgi:ankyrin repeat protein